MQYSASELIFKNDGITPDESLMYLKTRGEGQSLQWVLKSGGLCVDSKVYMLSNAIMVRHDLLDGSKILKSIIVYPSTSRNRIARIIADTLGVDVN